MALSTSAALPPASAFGAYAFSRPAVTPLLLEPLDEDGTPSAEPVALDLWRDGPAAAAPAAATWGWRLRGGPAAGEEGTLVFSALGGGSFRAEV